MKFRVFAILITLALLLSMLGFGSAPNPNTVQKFPANPEKILELLIREGKVSANAPKDVQEEAVLAYLRQKSGLGGPDKGYNPLARKLVDAHEAAMESVSSDLHGRKLGKQGAVDPATPQWKSLELDGTDKLLLILVDFSDQHFTWQPVEGPQRTEAGPLHNHIPVPNNDFDLYVPDFSPAHYQAMMFTPGGWTFPAASPRYAGEKRGSMYDYFLQQSYGRYTVEGETYGWFTVDKPEAYYGDDRGSGSDNMAPGFTSDLLADAIAKINSTSAIDWLAYDEKDLYDLDSDGDVNEPDCIVDHPLFIHAGIDQSGGGGAQGNDAIWAHSSSVWEKVAPSVNPGATCSWGYTIISNYTIMPEDGGVGVFAHEFAHDLGLPDEYDTAYSGRGDSNAFWTLQSTGSWVGRPAQTQPSGMSAWAKYALGWNAPGDNMAVVHVNNLTTTPLSYVLDQSERWGGDGSLNALRISLPQKPFYVNTPHSGAWEWFGGKADQIDTTLVRTVDLTGKTSASLSFWTWYEIEEFWDFGFVQVSTDGGATWASLPIAGTTSTFDPSAMPSIVANLPGFTGSSGGWVNKTIDLSAYVGQSIMLQFRYMTDWGTTLAGFYVDDIGVTADGAPVFFDDVETLDGAWTTVGWTRDAGSGLKTHYYIMEWRNLKAMQTTYDSTQIVNFDNGLTSVYQHDPYGSTGNPDQPWYFSYNPGLLVFYRDFSYTDNWTGFHPGHGFMLVLDAHDQAILRPPYLNYGSLPWNSRVQSYDATFSLNKAYDMLLGYWGKTRYYSGLNALPNFDDTKIYWNKKAPAASVINPQYDLLFRVAGQAGDGSAAALVVGKKNLNSANSFVSLPDTLEGFVAHWLPLILR